MTYVMTTHSDHADPENYRKVSDRVSEHADGLIARYAGTTESGLAITTVWQSKAHSDRFVAEHLVPAIRDIVGEPGGTGTTIDFEAFDVDVRNA
jgi:hypothetical protein